MSRAPVELLVYEFGPDAVFEGQLGGALQRLESGGALRILDVLFVRRDAASGELEAFAGRGDGAGGITGSILDFRLDRGARVRATRRALAGERGTTLMELGERLAPGGALAAIYVEHRGSQMLADAAARVGGSLLVDEFVDDEQLAKHLP